MNLAELADPVGAIVAFTLTLLVISYIFGDNPLFRLASHVLIGVAAGYAMMVVVYNVFWYQLLLPLYLEPLAQLHLTVPPLLLGGWLLVKASPRLARFGNPVLAFLVGVGAATAIGGAVLGTLFPQVGASIDLLNIQAALRSETNLAVWLFNAVLVLAGTVATLVYFHFGARKEFEQAIQRRAWVEGLAWLGKAFIAITFGVLFAGVYLAALAAFINRVIFVWDFLWEVITPFLSLP